MVETSASASQVITINRRTDGLPDDPATIAPPLDDTVPTNIFSATEFLYTGINPIQTGVVPGTFEAHRVAVLRGQVLNRDGQPIPGVTINILDHVEYGQTLSRADGMFDLVVNGGGMLTLNYTQTGFLSAQRQVTVPWTDYTWLPDLIMLQLDPNVTAIDLTTNTTMQTARGSVISDSAGVRQATVFSPLGITAVMTMTNGTTQALPALSVRATEFTVGDSGLNAMPGDLPSNWAGAALREFCSQAQQAGAQDVGFSQAVPIYNENFLGFPAGTSVPVGYYDRARSLWLPSDNGLVINVVRITNGMAELDVDGSGTPPSAAALIALGISDAERTRLAHLYAAGQSLWRIPVHHFSAWDAELGHPLPG